MLSFGVSRACGEARRARPYSLGSFDRERVMASCFQNAQLIGVPGTAAFWPS